MDVIYAKLNPKKDISIFHDVSQPKGFNMHITQGQVGKFQLTRLFNDSKMTGAFEICTEKDYEDYLKTLALPPVETDLKKDPKSVTVNELALSEGAKIVKESQDKAAEVVAASQAEAEKIKAEATEEIAKLKADALEEIAKLKADAQAEAEKIKAEATKTTPPDEKGKGNGK